MSESRPCNRSGCPNLATSAVGVAIYPPKSVMRYYRTEQWLTRMILTLDVCDTCFADLKVEELLEPKMLDAIIKMCEKSSGTSVNRKGSQVVKVSWDDPEYKLLVSKRTEPKP